MISIIYYAHPIETYGSEQESEDVAYIETFFYNALVFNPNRVSVQYSKDPMRMCLDLVKDESITMLVYRENAQGKVTQGIDREIRVAKALGKPILKFEGDSIITVID